MDAKSLGPPTKKLVEILQEEIAGQENLIGALAKAHELHLSELRDRNRPIGVFLILGTTGTGKNQSAHGLAKAFFNNPEGFTYCHAANLPIFSQYMLDGHHHRLLMSMHEKEIGEIFERGGELYEKEKEVEDLKKMVAEMEGKISELEQSRENPKELAKLKKNHGKFQDILKSKKDAVSKEGMRYRQQMAAAEEEGWLYDADHPPRNLVSVVLIDRIEDARKNFFDFLVEVMESGQFDIGKDEVVSFRNSFILITGSLNDDELKEFVNGDDHPIGFHPSHHQIRMSTEKKVQEWLRKQVDETLPPAVLSRIETVVLKKLSAEDLKKILDRYLRDLHNKLVAGKTPMVLEVENAVKEHLVKKAMESEDLGGWAIESLFRELIKMPLARLINSGQVGEADKLSVQLENKDGREEIVFSKI